MKDEVFEIYTVDLSTIQENLAYFTDTMGTSISSETEEILAYIHSVQQYESPKHFLKNAPPGFLDSGKVLNTASLIKGWRNVIENRDELERVITFLNSVILPNGEVKISFFAQSLSDSMDTVVFKQPHRINELLDKFDILLRLYTREYHKFHKKHNEMLVQFAPAVDEIFQKAGIIHKLASVPKLTEYCEHTMIDDLQLYPEFFMPCEYEPTDDDIRTHFSCPKCHRNFLDSGIAPVFNSIDMNINMQFDKCMRALALKLSDKILDSQDDPLNALVKAISISDLSAIQNIFSDKLLERIRFILS